MAKYVVKFCSENVEAPLHQLEPTQDSNSGKNLARGFVKYFHVGNLREKW